MACISLGDLLTVEEVAERLRVKTCTVRLWRNQRRIPFTRIGKRLYVSIRDIESILERNTVPVAAQEDRSASP